VVTSAFVIRTAIRLMRVTPVPVARAAAATLGLVAWAVMGRRRRGLLENLRYTASDASRGQRARLVRRTFTNMALCAVDQFRLPSIRPDALRALFEVRGIEHLDAAHAMGRGTIVVSGHIGPYELAAACVAADGYPIHGMVENLDPVILEALTSYRAATGMGIVNMRDGIREAYRILAQKRILLLAADRAIGEARSAIEMPFAGGVRRVPTGPATFSMATGAPIVVGFASLRRGRTPRYQMEFDPPILPRANDEAERVRLTELITSRIAAFVQSHPDQWFVFHARWVTHGAA
jgi:KDO2-lipid IV(A) lauroyltransferase